jgi:predicted permease
VGFWSRLAHTFNRTRHRQELEEELELHIGLRAEEYERAGVAPEVARRRAEALFGSRTRTVEDTMEADTFSSLERVATDFKEGVRAARRSPGFVLASAITLALGTSGTTSMFTLVNALLLRPVAAAEPGRLVSLTAHEGENRVPLLRTMVEQIREERVFGGVCGFLTFSVTADIADRLAPTQIHPMTGDCFETLGIRPARGRLFGRDDERAGMPHVVVLTWDTWQSDYGGRADLLSESINIDGTPYSIIGVTERGFHGLENGYPARAFIPFGNFNGGLAAYFPPPDMMSMSVVARLARGENRDDVRPRLDGRWPTWLASSVSERMPPRAKDAYLRRILAVEDAGASIGRGLRQRFARPLIVLFGISAVLLLMTCLSTANLLVARAAMRQREYAIRLAVGASRGRLFREAVGESVVVMILALAVALAAAFALTDFLIVVFQRNEPAFGLDLSPDLRTFGFIGATALAAWALFALAPAWRVANVRPARFGLTAMPTLHGRRFRQAAVAVQVALSVVLLSIGALLVDGLETLREAPLGFTTERVLSAQLSALPGGYDRTFDSAVHYRALLDRVESSAEIRSVALVRTPPLSEQAWKVPAAISGDEREVTLAQSFVTDGFFDTLRIPVIAGTTFRRSDRPSSPRTAILSASAARQLFGEVPPVGRFIRVGAAPINQRLEVIAVVGDAVLGTPKARETAVVYLNFWQFGAAIQTYPTLLVHAKTETSYTPVIDRLVRESGREYVSQVRTLEERRDAVLVRETLLASVATAFSAVAVVLAAVGLYALLTFIVARRRTEIGIRISIGATRWRILRNVVGETVTFIVVAIGLGLGVAVAIFRVLASQMVASIASPWEPLFTAAGVIVFVGCAAAMVPTIRAIRTNPVDAIRVQ